MSKTITGTNEQYNELYFFCKDSRPEACAYFQEKHQNLYSDSLNKNIKIATFPSWVHDYLKGSCPMYKELKA